MGRRLYHVHREKRVEVAMKQMQQGMGQDWKLLSEADVHLLSHLLQCTWNTIDQGVWDRICFVNAKAADVRKILSYGEGVKPGRNPDRSRWKRSGRSCLRSTDRRFSFIFSIFQ